MAKIPSRYIPVNYLSLSSGSDEYFDTGVMTSNSLQINGLFHHAWQGDLSNYYFGARNTNSNTSAGQLWMSDSYVGYRSARIGKQVSGDKILFTNTANEISLLAQARGTVIFDYSDTIQDITGAAGSFTGTRNMYILAMNNAGSVSKGDGGRGKGVYAFIIRDPDNEENNRDYCPVYDTQTAKYGLYDKDHDSFLLPNQVIPSSIQGFLRPKLLHVEAGDGGTAFIRTTNAGNVTDYYVTYDGAEVWYAEDNFAEIRAVPQNGYVFLNWTKNGEIISNEATAIVEITADTTITANFIKKSDIDLKTRFQAMMLKYGAPNYTSDPQLRKVYGRIREAEVVEDSLGHSTSTITLEEVPADFRIDVPLCIYTPTGKMIYCGHIENINGNKVTCREPLSVLNGQMIIDASTSSQTALSFARLLASRYVEGLPKLADNSHLRNKALIRKLSSYKFTIDKEIYMDPLKNCMVQAPSIAETAITNLEEFLLDMANDYDIYFKPSLTLWGGNYYILLSAIDTNRYDTLTVADNAECISSVNVQVEENAGYTMLEVFNSAGSTLRGIYGVKKDGSIAELVNGAVDDSFVCYDDCKLAVVMSNDKISILQSQYLSNAFYNHKITFDVDLDSDLYSFNDFEIGKRVNFYYGRRMFYSIITGREYKISQDSSRIRSLKITLGKVRNSLTSKINLGKARR